MESMENEGWNHASTSGKGQTVMENDRTLQSECNKNVIWTADQKKLRIVWCHIA